MTPDPTRSAQARMVEAKRQFTRAAEAAMRGDPGAVALVDSALTEVEAARLSLSKLDESAEFPISAVRPIN